MWNSRPPLFTSGTGFHLCRVRTAHHEWRHSEKYWWALRTLLRLSDMFFPKNQKRKTQNYL